MKIKNETEIQLMRILFKTSGKKSTKNITSQRAYPHGVEMKYFRQLKGFFKPLTDYVNKYIDEHLEPLLRGDSTEIHLDTIPGQSFRNMIYNLENWLSIYMPDISDLSEDSNNNVIFTALGKTADEAKAFGDKEFQKTIEKGIHVNPPTTSEWWEDMKNSWAEDNYSLITSNAKKYVSQINTLTEQAIVNGLSPAKLKEQIKKATEGLSDKHCKLLARDQMGKLNGQITESQMQEIGLDLYVWSTAYDDRVRDSHAAMEGLLCRWDDASVCSYDNGKTWVDRPSNAVQLHPGQDIQCRCVALSFYPELEAEMEGVSMNEITSDLPDVQDTITISDNAVEKYISNFQKDFIDDLSKSEKSAFSHYTEAYYNAVNNFIRNREILFGTKKDAKKLIKQMDNSFAKVKPLDIDVVVYRREYTDTSVNYNPTFKKGEIKTFESFTSTSLMKDSVKGKGNLFYEIRIPKGKKAGIYIDSLSSHDEKEFLLNRNMKYKVIDSEQLKDSSKKVVLEFIGE